MSAIDYHALLPEIILALTIVATLIVDLFTTRKSFAAITAMAGMFATFVPILTLAFCDSLEFCTSSGAERVLFGGSFVVDGYTLVLTVDVPVAGNRLRDIYNGLTIPPRLTFKTILDGAMHPAWWGGHTSMASWPVASMALNGCWRFSPPTTDEPCRYSEFVQRTSSTLPTCRSAPVERVIVAASTQATKECSTRDRHRRPLRRRRSACRTHQRAARTAR